MTHQFSITYRTLTDPRRTTRFFEATPSDTGFAVYFPDDFAQTAITLEAVRLMDESLIQNVIVTPTEADLEWARRELEAHPEWLKQAAHSEIASKTCPRCGKLMVECWQAFRLFTAPSETDYRWHCFGCNHSEHSRTVKGAALSDLERWRLINDE